MPKHECTKCGATFSRHFDLSRHVRLHMPETFRCQLCPQTFLHLLDRNVHIQHAHRGLLHTCATCGAVYASRSTMHTHKCGEMLRCRSREAALDAASPTVAKRMCISDDGGDHDDDDDDAKDAAAHETPPSDAAPSAALLEAIE